MTDYHFKVGVLGATGAVGQRFLELLSRHPWFTVVAVGASERSAGKPYSQAAKWNVSADIPHGVKELIVLKCSAEEFSNHDVDFVFSGLDSSVAGEVEDEFAQAGIPVFSNAKNHRMDKFVPILIPLINPEHLEVVKQQKSYSQSGGFIVTNANCASTGVCISLMPIHREFGITQGLFSTLQAVSGAGYPGTPFLDIHDNVIPFISGEEDKLETEPNKILGTCTENGDIEFTHMKLSAHCHRVAVSNGHVVSVSLKLKEKGSGPVEAAVKSCMEKYQPSEIVQSLPSYHHPAIKVREEDDRPQPALDRTAGEGMSVVVGRVRPDPIFDVKMVTLSHNTVIGAAGGSILNAELAVKKGLITRKSEESAAKRHKTS